MILVWLTSVFVFLRPVDSVKEKEVTKQCLKFLEDKGYVNQVKTNKKSKTDITKSIKRFQWFARIPMTGLVDEATVKKLAQPRCGMKDFDQKQRRHKRFVLQGSMWKKKGLSYRIVNYSRDLSKRDIRHAIKKALHRWQSASQLRFFEKRRGVADIMIEFTRRNHSDPFPFDGPGGTLGHAFYPGEGDLAGDTHFDDDEQFSLTSTDGKDFFWVTMHEFGHALGLEHSNTYGTIMYPWYDSFKGRKVDLSRDDELAIQLLYGLPRRERYHRQYLRESDSRNACLSKVETIFLDDNHDTIVINDDKAYKFDKNLRFERGPLHIKKLFRAIKNITKIDAAFRSFNDTITVLAGERYWRYQRSRLYEGPSDVCDIGFTKEMKNVDATFRWSKDNKIYVFKGDKYWQYDEKAQKIGEGFPKLIKTDWNGVPDNIDTVFQWRDGHIFFFKGENFYKFNSKRMRVNRHYPLPIRNTLLICKKRHAVGELNHHPVSSSKRTIFREVVLLYLISLHIALTKIMLI